jgi:GNAT superfamily N-acetyltransferase
MTEAAPFTVALSDGDSDLDGVLALQRANLRTRISPAQALQHGFVTVEHTRDILEQMHALGPSVVARSGGEVVGYALTMTAECRPLLPVLEPMFARCEELSYGGRRLVECGFYVMGQICVAEAQRGRGVFDALYEGHRTHFQGRYELLVTEISARNGRSLRAHARVGFRELIRFRDETDDWVIVGWDFGTSSD